MSSLTFDTFTTVHLGRYFFSYYEMSVFTMRHCYFYLNKTSKYNRQSLYVDF